MPEPEAYLDEADGTIVVDATADESEVMVHLGLTPEEADVLRKQLAGALRKVVTDA